MSESFLRPVEQTLKSTITHWGTSNHLVLDELIENVKQNFGGQ